eukprot:TRINITY_DN75269_c0_g1_i1.p1 TRINITY_DN75269_c0_g1~~TRINITY_DN75269_c0_g1_i1.p1  ORF type:complete len:364 (+),score=45.35 TRINITY_DN75269_c0_g1_i1:47-1093(+)
MASVTPPCCPSGSHPALQEPYTPKGSFQHTEKTQIDYYQYCPSKKTTKRRVKLLLVFTDVFGMHSGRHREICDQLGDGLDSGNEEIQIVMPDMFRGNPIAGRGLDTSLSDDERSKHWFRPGDWVVCTLARMIWRIAMNYPWMTSNGSGALRDDILEVVEEVVSKSAVSTASSSCAGKSAVKEVDVACLGFCFGGWVVAKFCGDMELLSSLEKNNNVKMNVCAGMSGHPSWNLETIFHWGSEDALAREVRCPLLLLPAGNDSARLKAPDGSAWRVLANENARARESRSIEFADMKHGWVTRGCRSGMDKAVAPEQDRAIKEFVDFLKKHLVKDGASADAEMETAGSSRL